MGALNLSVSTWNYISQAQDADLSDVIREIKQDGFGIELWMSWTPNREQFNQENLPAIKKQLEGFGCVTVHASNASMRQNIDVAAYLGAEVVVVHANYLGLPTANNQPIEGWGQAEKVAAYAKDKGVILALENGPLAVMRQAVDRLHIGICVDVGHAHLDQAGAGSEPVIRFLTEFAEDLAVIHIHDNHSATPGQPFRVAGKSIDEHLKPGDGTIHWARVFEHIRSIRFDGPCVLELKTSHARQAAMRAREFLNRESVSRD